MVLTQNGNQITGTYTYDNGKISGTISGNKLTGIWSEAPSYSAPNDAGDVILEMAADGKSFSGKLRYGDSGDWIMSWKGTRVGTATSAPSNESSVVNQPTANNLENYLKTENLSLIYQSGSSNPVTVKWDPTKQTVAVSYDREQDYFEFSNSADASGTVLYKYNESSKKFEAVPNIVGKVIAKGSPRNGNEGYGEAVLAFEKSGSVYNLSAGKYAVSIYIVGDGYTHSSPSDELFGFEVGASQPTTTPVTTPTTTTPSTSGNNSAESFPSGAKLSWEKASGILGYRLYRSETSDQLGISVTDFYITSTSFADVNAEPNTTYRVDAF